MCNWNKMKITNANRYLLSVCTITNLKSSVFLNFTIFVIACFRYSSSVTHRGKILLSLTRHIAVTSKKCVMVCFGKCAVYFSCSAAWQPKDHSGAVKKKKELSWRVMGSTACRDLTWSTQAHSAQFHRTCVNQTGESNQITSVHEFGW